MLQGCNIYYTRMYILCPYGQSIKRHYIGDREMKEFEIEADIDTKISIIEISYKDEKTDAYGRLFVNDEGKLDFEGNATESARVFFEECLKPACEKYIEELKNRKT